MRADLFKDVLVEAGRPGFCRLLFECNVESDDDRRPCRDFYLYVWVRDARQVTAFQAVMDEEYVLTFKEDAPPSFGTIGYQPIGRAISESSLPEPRRRIVGILGSLQNEDLPIMLRRIAETAAQRRWREIDLEPSEWKLVSRLLKAKKKGRLWR